MNSIKPPVRSLESLFMLACLMVSSTLHAQSPPGIPEPGLIIYGRVLDRQTGQSVQANSVGFVVTGNGDTANVAATFVSINGQSFYVAQVPFETRVVGVQTFQKTPNTLALATGNITYTRTASVNGRVASFKTAGARQFFFGATERGKVEVLDLEIEDPNIDTDGDGAPDWAETVAGTDPRDPQSVFKLQTSLKPSILNGVFAGITIEWSISPGKAYSIFRTSDLSKPFELIGTAPATPPTGRFTDLGAVGPGPFFYRVKVNE